MACSSKGFLLAAVLAAGVGLGGPAHALVNLALNAPVAASSEVYGAASLANDGSVVNTYPNIFESGLDVNPYWIVDLGAVYLLNDVHIFQRNLAEDNGERRLSNWTLTLYGGGTLAAPTGVVTSNTFDTVVPSSVQDIDVTTGVTGQSARFVRINLNATDYLALAEVQVFQQAGAVEVMEPGALGVVLVGLAGVGVMRRRGARVRG